MLNRSILLLVCSTIGLHSAVAIDTGAAHQHGQDTAKKVEAPTIFLDKSPRIVEYQLKRLDSQRLLLVDRKTDDVKYIPVYEAILGRDGMTPQFQQEAVEALAKLRETDAATELLAVLAKLDTDDRQVRRNARSLVKMLLGQPAELLAKKTDLLEEASKSDSEFRRAIGYAGLIVGGNRDQAWSQAQSDSESKIDWASSIPLLPKPELRIAARDRLAGLITDDDARVRAAAITAIASVPAKQAETFELVAPLVSDDGLRRVVVQTLLRVPAKLRGAETSADLAATLVNHAETTPPAKRTTDEFIDAMQLADQLLAKLPSDQAKAYRNRLSEVTVRVIKIKTVEEEMRYDIPYFVVEAGRPVQVLLENHDLMPHNLVITRPGKLKEIANLGLQVGPSGGWKGLPYVPESDDVLESTAMVQPDKSDRITFDAPTEPGEYPYVCTFPQHWYRMYGVMVVVKDLDAWNKNPVEPANPIGSNRSFVQSWNVDDLKDELDGGMRGRTADIGAKVFVEASCKGCHKAAGEGGVIGPDLTDLFTRWKGDRVGILREILDPSHKVDAKYQMHQVLTADGRVVSGIIVAETDDDVTILENPEAKDPTVIAQDDIDEMLPSKNSMMPKALMDQYTKDEIFELMAYLESINPKK
tara:strand:+ start:165312 stop:167237 length:1926 start_codon:yes stop_codon:yes gene_type:complete